MGTATAAMGCQQVCLRPRRRTRQGSPGGLAPSPSGPHGRPEPSSGRFPCPPCPPTLQIFCLLKTLPSLGEGRGELQRQATAPLCALKGTGLFVRPSICQVPQNYLSGSWPPSQATGVVFFRFLSVAN